MRKMVPIVGWLAALVFTTPVAAHAAEIKLIGAGAVRAVVSGLAETFAQESGHSVKATFGTMGVVRQKLAAEPADVVIGSDTVLEDLIKQGTIVAGTRVDIARAGVGVGVRDPAQGATSGIHFTGVLQRLGIADAVKGKTILWPGGYAAEAVAKGDAEIVVHQISEILPVKGVTLIGPLPRDLQKITVDAAGLATKAEAADAARTFIAYLTRPVAKAKFAGAGLDYKE